MTYARCGVLAAALIATALSAIGCCDKEKRQIASLQGEYNELSNQNKDLRDQLSQAKTRQAELLADLESRGATISELEKRKGEEKAPKGGGPAAEGWEIGVHADRVTVGTDILFTSGKAALTSAGHAALDKIAATLRSTYAGLSVRVYGYTDSDPIHKTKNLWQDNLDLSANRAMAVTRYLRSKGISADSIETIGMGETHPVTSNASAAGKAKNRRVEIVVIKTRGPMARPLD